MSSTSIELRPAMGAQRVGQATAVEQSRAVAEVQAAVIVAQQCPRSVTAAITAMEEACRQIELAEQAFFRFPRADGTVEGPSVHLARELARCWGNVQYGVRELARDDFHGQSEMQAWAWDVQTNTRSSSDFIVPHKRDTKKGVRELTDMRDIYENNANNGARRAREAIFTVLPAWYRARAEKLCRETLAGGGGVPLAQRIADAVKAFERHRVSAARMAARFGYERVDELTAADVAQLGVIFSSIGQGTVTVADEFPDEPGRITPADLAPAAPPATADASPAGTDAPQSEPPADPPAAAPAGDAQSRRPNQATTGQVGMIRKRYADLYGYAVKDETDEQKQLRLVRTGRLAGIEYPGITTTKDLTADEAGRVLVALQQAADAKAIEAAVAAMGANDGE